MRKEEVMKMFPIGSRVLVSNPYDLVDGREGVVAGYSGIIVGVDFGDTGPVVGALQRNVGHNLNGAINTDTGWYCPPNTLRLIDQPHEIEPEIEWDMIIK